MSDRSVTTPSPAADSAKNTCRAGTPNHYLSSEENPMVKPTTTSDLRLTVSGELLARAETAYERFAVALQALADEGTAERARALATAERDLAAAYLELQREFCDLPALYSALTYRAFQLKAEADDDDAFAAHRESRTAWGDAA